MVRIWNLPVEELDDQHLLGEHLELHIIWKALTDERRQKDREDLIAHFPGWRNVAKQPPDALRTARQGRRVQRRDPHAT